MLVYEGEEFAQQTAQQPLVHLRILPVVHRSFAPTVIYGDKMAIELLESRKPENTAVIVIENLSVAASYLANFEALWKIARPYRTN
jgi:hypothetical protein